MWLCGVVGEGVEDGDPGGETEGELAEELSQG